MGAVDDLIKRAIETSDIPTEEVKQFAEEIGKIELYNELTNNTVEQAEMPAP